jgi:hypothetical protein
MRKIELSGENWCSVLLSERADARSRPNGFSTTTRAFFVRPASASLPITVGNVLGGIAR